MGYDHHNIRHGHYANGQPTRTYRIWRGMMNRCYNPNVVEWEHYGGKGVTVCEHWHVFENFLEHFGEIPEPLSLDRKNSDGDYEPENVRLATPKEQANNRSNNVHLTYNGETRTCSQWSEHLGIPKTTIRNRIKAGYPVERILEHKNNRKKLYTYNGITKSTEEWATIIGTSPSWLSKKLRDGKTIEDMMSWNKWERC